METIKSIKEKAKAYDRAVEQMRSLRDKLLNDGIIKEDGVVNSDFQRIFPELKESEDERIKRDIIEVLRYGLECEESVLMPGATTTLKEATAWLEKQGEQKTAEDVDILYRFSFYSYKDEPNILYLSGLYVNKEQRNKGIGTNILKIADKVTTTMKCSLIRLKTEIGSNAERLYRKNGYNSLKREGNQIWLEKQGEQILDNSAKTCKDEHKHAWSENDEIALGDALWCCKQAAIIAKDENDMGNIWYAERWLKSIKERIQPQQEWSEEDEKKLSRIYSILGQVADEHAFCNTCRLIGDKECVELQDWLKTLEDRYCSLPKHEWNENEL